MDVFDVDQSERADPVALWNAITKDTFGPIAIAPLYEESFHARLARRRSGVVGLADVRSEPAVVEGATGTTKTRQGHFLLLDETGGSTVHQSGRELVLRPGNIAVVRADRPYRITFGDPNHMTVVHMPEASPTVDWERLTVDPDVQTDQPLVAELFRLWARAEATPSGQDGDTYARLVQDVLSVCWAPAAAERAAAIGWADRIEAFVSVHLSDFDLTARSVGQALGASARYVQMVMADQHTTFSQYVLRRRLTCAADRLVTDPQAQIATVAFACGFSDVSYFARAFRSQYGCTATEWRRATRA
jgi:AraC-like DNA-binding protein